MKIPIPILSAITVAAITVTACGTPPTTVDSGPSPSAACTQPPGAPPCPGGAAISRPTSAVADYEKTRLLAAAREMELNAAAGLPSGVDRGLAEAATKDNVPLVFTLGGLHEVKGSSTDWLRLPDRSLWQLHTGGPLVRDTWFEQLLAQYGGGLPAMSYATVRAPAFDAAVADAAKREGKPYRWTDGCKVFVHTGGWDFTLPEAAALRGEALRTSGSGVACTARGEGGN